MTDWRRIETIGGECPVCNKSDWCLIAEDAVWRVTGRGPVSGEIRGLDAVLGYLAELGETAVGSPHYEALFTIGIFLFVVTFIINLSADLIVRGVRNQ